MNKAEILAALQSACNAILATASQTEEGKFFERPQPGKWSAAENMEHLCLAVKPLNLAFALPNFALRLLFGKTNRASRSYESLTEKYKAKLAAGGRASAPFVPQPPATGSSRDKVLQGFTKIHEKFFRRTAALREADLDQYILPHPLLGKLTLREMLYFTIHHIGHHHSAIAEGDKRN
jgi:DinB superfamily